MKFLWILALSIISLSHIQAQSIDGTWISDWQNQGLSGCLPDNFTISGSGSASKPWIIQYEFTAEQAWSSCYQYNKGQMPTISNLYLNSTNVYNDSNYNIKLTYDPNYETISGVFYGQKPFLYTSTGNIISQTQALGTLGRIWSSRTPAAENSNDCCAPDSIFIALANPQFYLLAQFNAVYYFNTTTCSTTGTYNFQLGSTNPSFLNWTSSNNNDQIAYVPDSFYNDFTFHLTSGACQYTYTATTTSYLSETWLRDWQTVPDKYSPTSYEVSALGSSPNYYMVSTITNQNGTSYQSFLTKTPQGQYFDPYLNMNGTYFSYDETTNTLLSISTSPATEDALLLSTSGSLFQSSGFISYWINAVSTNSQALPSDCCVPSYIDIANNYTASNLSVIYYFPSDYMDNPGCQDIQHSIYKGQLESTLSVTTPNISQIVWTDFYGHQVFFASPLISSQIQVSNFLGQCSFNLVSSSTPPPTPSPAYSSVISIGIMSFITGFLLIFN